MKPHEKAKAADDALIYPDGSLGRKRPEFAEALRDYREREREIKHQFAADLAEEHLTDQVPTEISDKVFTWAWSEGHSMGYSAVEDYYEDLADLVFAAFEAGQGYERNKRSRAARLG